MNTPIRTCYISAPAGTNLDVLRSALSKRNIAVSVPDELVSGLSLQDQISDIISGVDLVIGVLTSERRSSWILFEIGIAWANKRLIILISPPKDSFIPSSLRRFLVLRANPSNSEAIEFALDQFLAASLKKRRPSISTKSINNTPNLSIIESFQTALSAVQNRDGRMLERVLAEVIRASGTEVVSEFSTGEGRRADMAIWSDVLGSVGNPILVEVKLRLRDFDEAKKVAFALSEQVKSAGTRWGILLYGEGFKDQKDYRSWLPTNVLEIDLVNLFDRMHTRSFPEIIKELRNQKVHGSQP